MNSTRMLAAVTIVVLSGCLDIHNGESAAYRPPPGSDSWQREPCDPNPTATASRPLYVARLFTYPEDEVSQEVLQAVQPGWNESANPFRAPRISIQSPSVWGGGTVFVRAEGIDLGINATSAEGRVTQILEQLRLPQPPRFVFDAEARRLSWQPLLPPSWPPLPLYDDLGGYADWEAPPYVGSILQIPIAYQWPDWPELQDWNQSATVDAFARCVVTGLGVDPASLRISPDLAQIGRAKARLALVFDVSFGESSPGSCTGGSCVHGCPAPSFQAFLDAHTSAVLDTRWQLCV